MFSSEILFAKSGSSFYNGVATQSLRVNKGDAGGLSRTVGSSITNRKKFTISAWVKPTHNTGLSSSGSARMFAGFGKSGGNYGQIGFYEDGIYFFEYGATSYLRTTRVFTDRTAWYNIQVIVDTTDSTAGDRNKIYVNGTRITDFGTQTNYPLNHDSNWNIADSATKQMVGTSGDTGGGLYQPFDGYISDFHFIDGSAVASTNFGELKNGVWIPKEYSGSYGDGGYHLEFKQTGTSADASGIGADTSGNNLHFSVTNYVASDANIPDCPEDNYPTMNPLHKGTDTITFTEGNLNSSFTSDVDDTHHGCTFALPKEGKWYWEQTFTGAATDGSQAPYCGIYDFDTLALGYSDNFINSGGDFITYYTHNNSIKIATSSTDYTGSIGNQTGAVVGFAVDMDNGHLWVHVNGTWINGTPTFSDGTNKVASPNTDSTYIPFWSGNGGGAMTWSANFGQSSFTGTKPSGYSLLTSANLPEPTLGPNSDEQPDDHFNTVIYNSTGDGQNITGVGFAPDLVWIKCRSTGQGHGLFDTSRGTGKVLSSDSTSAEGSSEGVKTFGSDGYTMGTYYNQSGRTYVSWNWKANAGSTTTNDASATGVGDIDSIYQANTTGGFSIVTYSGSLSSSGVATVAHGLGAAPKVVISKDTGNTGAWIVQHPSTSSASTVLVLNTTAGQSDKSGNGTLARPTSTVFSTNYTDGLNNSSKGPFVAYCFAEVDGMSKFGKFTSNGNADGAYIYVGFKPALFVAKSLGTENWIVLDNARPGYNPTGNYLYWNLTNTEGGAGGEYVDLLSNGVKIRTTGASIGSSGTEYIYMAWAEQPFKYSNAR